MIIGAIVVFVAIYIAIQAVERFYPELDMDEVNQKIETIEGYGFDTIVDMTESGVIIEKNGSMYIIHDPKTRVLNIMYALLFTGPIMFLSLANIFIIVGRRKERNWSAL